MSEPISRRDALKQLALLAGAAGVVAGGREPQAAELPHLKLNDPTAVALNYHDDTTRIDPKQFPAFQAGHTCGNCLQLQGAAGQPWRPCNLFPGMLVSADGWCRVWVLKS